MTSPLRKWPTARRAGALALSSVVFFLAGGPAHAHKLNPCLRVLTFDGESLGQQAVAITGKACEIAPEQYRVAIHEHMTVLAIDKYRGYRRWTGSSRVQESNFLQDPKWPESGGGRTHLTSSLIKGTWWNDDPLMHLWGEGWDFVRGARKLGELTDGTRGEYAGGLAGCSSAAKEHVGWHSHYGALQHLHFMTSMRKEAAAQERVRETTRSALEWMKFAYLVATRKVLATARLGEVKDRAIDEGWIARSHCVDAKNVKVRTVFSRIGPTGRNEWRNSITPDVALGTMLHILQDSFSPAHTCRVERKDGDGVKAVLKDVYNYNEQDKDWHGDRDMFPEWLLTYAAGVARSGTGTHMYANDPIAVGAWLIAAVDRDLAWEEVEKHLRSTIFLAADEGSAVAPGDCAIRIRAPAVPAPASTDR